MKLATLLVTGVLALVPGNSIQPEQVAPPALSISIWQGPQTTGNYMLEYLSSVLLQDIKVNGVAVPDGTVIQLWTPSISVTGIPSSVVGTCTVTNGQCILPIDMPITQEIAVTGNYATTFYLPSYNVSMGFGWRWKSCQ